MANILEKWGNRAKSVASIIGLLILVGGGSLAYYWEALQEARWKRVAETVAFQEAQDAAIKKSLRSVLPPLIENAVSSALEDHLHDHPPAMQSCSRIPLDTRQHSVTDTRIGEWGTVTWRVERLRSDCGQPVIYATIRNGDAILHGSRTSISGFALPVGSQTISYDFFVDEGVRPGLGALQVLVTYPDAVGGAPNSITPWQPFNILPSETTLDGSP